MQSNQNPAGTFKPHLIRLNTWYGFLDIPGDNYAEKVMWIFNNEGMEPTAVWHWWHKPVAIPYHTIVWFNGDLDVKIPEAIELNGFASKYWFPLHEIHVPDWGEFKVSDNYFDFAPDCSCGKPWDEVANSWIQRTSMKRPWE